MTNVSWSEIASGIVGYDALSNALRGSQTSTLAVSHPLPVAESEMALEKVVLLRKSIRDYSSQPITIFQLSSILWSAQVVTLDGLRTNPSTGAPYSLELYFVSRDAVVTNLQSGTDHNEI